MPGCYTSGQSSCSIFASIPPAELRRNGATLSLARRAMKPRHLLHSALTCPPSANARRLKSEKPICTSRTRTHQFVWQQQHTCGAVGGSPMEWRVVGHPAPALLEWPFQEQRGSDLTAPASVSDVTAPAYTIGVGAGKFLGVRRNFFPGFPKLARKDFVRLLPTN